MCVVLIVICKKQYAASDVWRQSLKKGRCRIHKQRTTNYLSSLFLGSSINIFVGQGMRPALFTEHFGDSLCQSSLSMIDLGCERQRKLGLVRRWVLCRDDAFRSIIVQNMWCSLFCFSITLWFLLTWPIVPILTCGLLRSKLAANPRHRISWRKLFLGAAATAPRANNCCVVVVATREIMMTIIKLADWI